MPCSPQIMSEMLLEIHSMEKLDFHQPIIYSQIFQCSVCNTTNTVVDIVQIFKRLKLH